MVRGSILSARQERNSLLKHFDRSQQAPKPPGPEPGYPPGNVPPPQPPDIPVPDPAPPPIENPGEMPLPPITDPDVVTPVEPNPAQTPTRVLGGQQRVDEPDLIFPLVRESIRVCQEGSGHTQAESGAARLISGQSSLGGWPHHDARVIAFQKSARSLTR
jgi:hypothetical protein